MSNVLKKITKKYKWLRFLNYKTTKLAVLSAALFGLCLSSGHSFAKYRDENYGNGNAGAAKFVVDFESIPTTISVAELVEDDIGDMFAFAAYFSIDFSNCEVKTNYTLDLRLAVPAIEDDESTAEDETWSPSWGDEGTLDDTSFISNEAPKTFVLNDQSYNKSDFVGLTGENIFSTSTSSAYYANGTKSGDTISYDWDRISIDSDNKTLSICDNKDAVVGDVHYYAVMFFIRASRAGNKPKFENSIMLYNLHIEQEVA